MDFGLSMGDFGLYVGDDPTNMFGPGMPGTVRISWAWATCSAARATCLAAWAT